MKNRNLKIGIGLVGVFFLMILFLFFKDSYKNINSAQFDTLLQNGRDFLMDNEYIYFQDSQNKYKIIRTQKNVEKITAPIEIKNKISILDLIAIASVLLILYLIIRSFYKGQNPIIESKIISSQKQNENTNTIEQFRSNTTFNDIAGIEDVKLELFEIIDYLKNPKKYTSIGLRLPRGILLVGPPGVGKSMIAKAIAGEAGVPFFYQSGSDFAQIYVGTGAKRVNELFLKAKSHAPSIIFIDEIDSVGKTRGGNRNDEREATLNQLLVQMDGFEDDKNIIIIGATNKVEMLDEALLRSGRFDRRIHIGLPNIQERVEILQSYLKNKKINFEIDEIAKNCVGFSGAMIEALINESGLEALRRGSETIELEDIAKTKSKITIGTKRLKALNENEKNILCIYQASKAIFAFKNAIFFQKISLVEDDFKIEDEFFSKTQILQQIKLYLSGIVGLEVITNELYSNAQNDIQKANSIAKDMCEKYGMGEWVQNDHSKIIQNSKKELADFIDKNKGPILALSKVMSQREVIARSDVENLLK